LNNVWKIPNTRKPPITLKRTARIDVLSVSNKKITNRDTNKNTVLMRIVKRKRTQIYTKNIGSTWVNKGGMIGKNKRKRALEYPGKGH
jgi:hypothetical protein